MVISCIFSYPPERVKEYAERVRELSPLPEYINIKGPYINRTAREGIITVAIYEFNEVKFPEASRYIFNLLGTFQGMPGFTCSTQVWAETKEALKFARFVRNSG